MLCLTVRRGARVILSCPGGIEVVLNFTNRRGGSSGLMMGIDAPLSVRVTRAGCTKGPRAGPTGRPESST